jgi:hypothetical protein
MLTALNKDSEKSSRHTLQTYTGPNLTKMVQAQCPKWKCYKELLGSRVAWSAVRSSKFEHTTLPKVARLAHRTVYDSTGMSTSLSLQSRNAEHVYMMWVCCSNGHGSSSAQQGQPLGSDRVHT